MSSSELAISVHGLSKAYKIRHQDENHITLAEQLLHRARHPLTRQTRETFWALSDATFELRKGEVLGVIGRNGAGKSTLLKLLSRITPPTRGEVRLYGRVGSLLEVGTGFHPELTGRENVYLNGAILGMRTKEIDRRFDEIVAFAGVERFLDTPVKRFSSGMYVRLAFAVAAHLDTEILLVDEVLAVGDVEFQQKCLGKMSTVAEQGRTVLLVTHQLAMIRQIATQCLLLEKGSLSLFQSPDAALDRYESSRVHVGAVALERKARLDPHLSREVELVALALADERPFVPARGPIETLVTVRSNRSAQPFRISFTIHTSDGTPLATAFTSEFDGLPEQTVGRYRAAIEGIVLAPGTYSLSIAVGLGNELSNFLDFDFFRDVLSFEVATNDAQGQPFGSWLNHFGPVWATSSGVRADDSSEALDVTNSYESVQGVLADNGSTSTVAHRIGSSRLRHRGA
jgi:lipopolysaccharide transport system ATP-binding protein